jgi:hypothetical protein
MLRWFTAGIGVFVLGFATLTALPAPVAGAAGPAITVKVNPNHRLVGGQSVTVSGKGLVKTYKGKPQTWFIAQCTGAVRGRLEVKTDTPHCNAGGAKQIMLGKKGTFSTHFTVVTGTVGDGSCGTAGNTTCVIGVGTVTGLGTVVKITFKPVAATSG